jgi:glycosyltransferase 2 family protein
MIYKLIITAGLFALIAYYIDLDRTWQVMAQASLPLLGLALLAQVISTLFAGYRWGLIMRALGFDRSINFYLRVYFIGSYFNQALPSSIGGDAVRIMEVGKSGYRKRDAFAGVFIDRAVGVLGLLVLNLASNLLFSHYLPDWLTHLINIITLGGIAGFLGLIFLRYLDFIEDLFLLKHLHALSSQAHRLYSNPLTLGNHTLLSLGSHIFSILSVFTIARSLGMNLDFQLFLVAMPPVFLLTFIPISLAGWGIREGAMVGIFLLVGADKDHILAVSIVYGLILIISSLPGGLFWLNSKHHSEAKAEAP